MLVILAVIVGVLYAIRAGLWVRETSPTAGESGDGGRPEHVAVEDEGNARFDVSDRERDPDQAREPRRETDQTRR